MDSLKIRGCFHGKYGFWKGCVKGHLVNVNLQANFLLGAMETHMPRIEDAVIIFEIRKNNGRILFTKAYSSWKRFSRIELKMLNLISHFIQKGELVAGDRLGLPVLEQGRESPCKGPQD